MEVDMRPSALVAGVVLAVVAAPAAAKEKKKTQSDIVITKPADKSSPTLQQTPGPAGPTPIPYPNTSPPAKRSTR
jgi:hypothetical protein